MTHTIGRQQQEDEMARRHEDEAPEVRQEKLREPVNIRGQAYAAGDYVSLTEEEYNVCLAAGVQFEGVEPKTPEEVQAAHDEGRAALEEKLAEGEEELKPVE
jgi:hypothetical protein